MTVYVIEEGEYSDRNVVAVRETLEEAKEYVDLKLKASSRRYYPETYGISAYDTKGNLVYSKDAYKVRFHDGKIVEITKCAHETEYLDYGDYRFSMVIHADNEDKVRKIAYDRMAEIKARRAGIL